MAVGTGITAASRALNERLKNRRLPTPGVVKTADSALARAFEDIAEHLRMYEGNSAAPKERFVTIQELESAGLIKSDVKQGLAYISQVLTKDVAQMAGSTANPTQKDPVKKDTSRTGRVPGTNTTAPNQGPIGVGGVGGGGGGGIGRIGALEDVSVATPAQADFLYQDGGQWTNFALFNSQNRWRKQQTFDKSLRLQELATGPDTPVEDFVLFWAKAGGQLWFTDDTGTETQIATGTGGQGIKGLGIWRYRTETSAPPSSGQIRFDNADISSATEFYIHETNDGGSDVSAFMDLLLTSGALVYMQDRTDADNAALIEIGSVVDNGSYRTVQITTINEQGAEPSQNTEVAIFVSGGGGGGVTDHGALTGLSDDDHGAVYGGLSQTEDITGDWTFDGLFIDGVHGTPPSAGSSIGAYLSFSGGTTFRMDLFDSVDASNYADMVLVADDITWVGFGDGNITFIGDMVLGAGAAQDTTISGANVILSGSNGLFGGTTAGDILNLTGATSSPDVGIVQINSPVTFTYDTFSNTTPAQQFLMQWGPTVTANGAYIGGALQTEAVFNITTGTFIPAIFSDTNIYNVGAAPGFSAITFINELSVVQNSGNFNLMSALVMNIGLTHQRITSGTSTTPGTTGVSFSPKTRAAVSGATMTTTGMTAVRCSPTYVTVSGSTVNLGTIRGLHCFQPAVALFGTGSGVENMTAYYGLDFNAMTFGGTAPIAVVRSALEAGTNQWFLLNNGNAVSDFGTGHIYFDDSGSVAFGGVGAGVFDVILNWQAAGYFRIFFNSTGDDLRISSPSADRFLFDNVGGSTTGEYTFNCAKFSLGAMTGVVGNNVGVFVAGTRSTAIAGEWSDFLLTQAGNITVDDAMGLVAGWTINAPSITLGTGSVTTSCGLNVAGNPGGGATNRVGLRILSNPSGGAGVNAALWITAGRAQFDGFVDINKPIALGGGAAATLGTIGGSGPTVAAQAQWVQIEVNGVNHWIPAWT